MINKKIFLTTFGLFTIIVTFFFIFNSKLYVNKYLFKPLSVDQIANNLTQNAFQNTADEITSLIHGEPFFQTSDINRISEMLHSKVVRFLQNNKSYIYSYSEKKKLSKKDFRKLKKIVGNISLEGAYFLNPRYLDIVTINFKYNEEADIKILFDYLNFIIYEKLMDIQGQHIELNFNKNLIYKQKSLNKYFTKIIQNLDYLNFYPSLNNMYVHKNLETKNYINVAINEMIDHNIKANLAMISNLINRLIMNITDQNDEDLILNFKELVNYEEMISAKNMIKDILLRFNKIPKNILINDLENLEKILNQIYLNLDKYEESKLKNGFLKSNLHYFNPEFKKVIGSFLNLKNLKMIEKNQIEIIGNLFNTYQKKYPNNKVIKAQDILMDIIYTQDISFLDINEPEIIEEVHKILTDINQNLNQDNDKKLKREILQIAMLDNINLKKDLQFMISMKKLRLINENMYKEIQLNSETLIPFLTMNEKYFNFNNLKNIYIQENTKYVSKKFNYKELLSNIFFAFVMSIIITFLGLNMNSKKEI